MFDIEPTASDLAAADMEMQEFDIDAEPDSWVDSIMAGLVDADLG